MSAERTHLAGMTCLACGVGRYGDGYSAGRVLPCYNCGADERASLTHKQFQAKLARRDPRFVEAHVTAYLALPEREALAKLDNANLAFLFHRLQEIARERKLCLMCRTVYAGNECHCERDE